MSAPSCAPSTTSARSTASSKLRSSARLARAADFHSWEMLDADYFAHESRDGGPFDERVRRYANHKALGETLAMLGGCGREGRAARSCACG